MSTKTNENYVMTIQPLSARVIIKQVNRETVTASGIIIPNEKKLDKGIVVAVGDGNKDNPVNVSIGDVIYFEAYAGQEIEKDGEKFLILKFEEVIAKDIDISEAS